MACLRSSGPGQSRDHPHHGSDSDSHTVTSLSFSFRWPREDFVVLHELNFLTYSVILNGSCVHLILVHPQMYGRCGSTWSTSGFEALRDPTMTIPKALLLFSRLTRLDADDYLVMEGSSSLLIILPLPASQMRQDNERFPGQMSTSISNPPWTVQSDAHR